MTVETDKHGQPKGFFNYRRNRNKAFRHLYGILEGVQADRRFTDPEIQYLRAWLNDNALIADDPDVRDLREDLALVLRDGIVSSDERADLLAAIDTILEYRGGRATNETDAVNRLHGFLSGIAADRELVDAEILELEAWLEDHRRFAAAFPLDVVLDRVSTVLADRRVTEEERADLLETIGSLEGGSFTETGAAGGLATRHTFDAPEVLPHLGHVFCVTGKFAWGPRRRVNGKIESLGGKIADNVTKRLSYLLVGTFSSRDWAGTSHGRKIEKALDYRQNDGTWPLLVAEEDWLTIVE